MIHRALAFPESPTTQITNRRPSRGALVLLLGALAVGSTPVAAQVCVGDVTLSSQAQVDTFAYTSVTGTLTVTGGDIVDLHGLSGLTSVGGVVKIQHTTELTNLDGLSGLTSAGSLWVRYNGVLRDLDGLRNLPTVGGDLLVARNQRLTNLDGLSGLTSVDIGVVVILNPALTNLDGLSGVTFCSYLQCADNSALTSFRGLYSLSLLLSLGYEIVGNAEDPDLSEILAAGPCDPVETLTRLVDDGDIAAQWMRPLSEVLSQPTAGLSYQLAVCVGLGVMTTAKAQLLTVIAYL